MIPGKLVGRGFIKKPACPFCGNIVEPPQELATGMPLEMPLGTCSCGAVYACDITGHNIGVAMVEALVFGCNMDWDLAWSLLPEEDYLQKEVEHYDPVNHIVVPRGVFEGRRIAGVLLFIRLHDDVLEVTAEGVRKRIDRVKRKLANPPTTPGGPKKQLSKKEIERLVAAFDPGPIIEVAAQDKKIIRNLQRLLYSPDPEFRHRAAEILGMASAVIADYDPAPVSKLLQRLFTAISDTAASSWGAFEAIAQIISHKTEIFGGYLSQLFFLLTDESKRADSIYAIGTIAKARPELLRKYTFHFIPFLQDQIPSVRGYTAWLLGNLGAHEVKEDLRALVDDSSPISLYENGLLESKTVGQIAKEALERL